MKNKMREPQWHPGIRTIGSLLAAGAILASGMVGFTAGSASASNPCVAPSAAVISVHNVDGQPDTYVARLKQPGTVTCTDWKVNVSSYKIPDTWDHNGWNETILPQVEFAHRLLVLPAGQQEPVTVRVPVPTCGSYQTDAYTGPELTRLGWPSPMGDVKLDGTIHAVPVSENCQPKPPHHVTPPVKKATGHVTSGCSHHRGFVNLVMNNRHSKNGSRRNATAVYRLHLGDRHWKRYVHAGLKINVWRYVPRGTHFGLRVYGHSLGHGKVTQVCKRHHHTPPPSGPPDTGEKNATASKVVSGKA
jgi:hypothetical protein